MIITDFIGGADTQRSLNHSDNRLINLYPTLNDKGDIAAFYGTPGLTLEVTNPGSAVGSGIYTASNGRCFEVAGTTLYELTESDGVISTTSRGTVTVGNPIYRMSDNGIEMILVNGTDGWLFTFSTNALIKIKVATADFTVTIADPAVFTKTAHGLVAGDAFRVTSTTGDVISDTVISAMSPATVSAGASPISVVISPNGNFAYCSMFYGVSGYAGAYLAEMLATPKNVISQYSRGVDGKITALSPTYAEFSVTGSPGNYTGGSSAGDLIFSSDGISAYLACNRFDNNVGNSSPCIALFDANTATGDLVLFAYYQAGTGVYPDQYPKANKLCISADTGHVDAFIYVTTEEDRVYQFSRNLVNGELSALTPAYVSTGVDPQDIVISTDGLFAYVANLTDSTITLFSRVPATGLLTSVSAVSSQGLNPIDIALAVEADNPYLYVTNSGSNAVAVFSRDSGTGVLTYIESTSTGTNPRGLIVTAESAYTTNFGSGDVSQFIRSSATGLLTAASTPTINAGSSPLGIAISSSGDNIYVANYAGNSVSQYSRNGTAATIGLPTGLAELTTYYVLSSGLTADAFQASETAGGTAISTSGQQAGVHTYTTLGYGFPEGCKTVTYVNGRFFACENGTQNLFCSEVLDGKWWDPLNVQTVDSSPDNVIGEIASHGELIVFGPDSGEILYDSGTVPTPFVRREAFEVGCVAPYSICKIDNQVFWLGGNKNGDGIVYKLQGYSAVRASKHSNETDIQGMTDISDARGFVYQQDGHHFYCLSFPTGDKTYCLDINTGLWHERANFAAGTFSRWVAQEHAFFAKKHLVLSYADGKIYSIDPTAYTYGTEDRKWLRSFKVPTSNMERIRHSKLQLHCEAGVGLTGGDEPTVMLRWSDDGGHTWSNEAWRSIGVGSTGEYAKRVIWWNLGLTKGQPRIYELSGTAAVKIALISIHIE
jgi:6-phosphogluconolactonase (cycloisomerase 2 family)